MITIIKNNIRVSLPNQTLIKLSKFSTTDLIRSLFAEIKFFISSVDDNTCEYTNIAIPRISFKFQSKDPTDYYTPVVIFLLVDSQTTSYINVFDKDLSSKICTLNPPNSIDANLEEAFNFILNSIRNFWKENYV